MQSMNKFIQITLLFLVLQACSTIPKDKYSASIEKAKLAMLCMQRAAWEQGVAMQALIETGDTADAIAMAHEAVLRQKPDGRLAMLYSDWNVSDPASNGRGVLFAFQVTKDSFYLKAAKAQYQYYLKPETRTSTGNIRHNNTTMQLWSDNGFMQIPFLAFMGNYDESIVQIEGLRKFLWDHDKKMFCHIYDEGKKEFVDKSHWGGGNGWCAAGMAQVIDLLPEAKYTDKQKIIGYCKELIDGCLKYMLPNGLFYDKIDEKNFVETNLAQMLAFTIYKGIKSGWLDKSYKAYADKMRQAAHLKIDRFGFVQDVCSSPSFDRPGTSTEGQAFFLMMEAAFQKLESIHTN
jgi:unsaturated rhamnogalacturonyl hydrolase